MAFKFTFTDGTTLRTFDATETTPPPPLPEPASGGVKLDNATLYADGSFWRTQLPASTPTHPNSALWMRNLCLQMGVDPDAIGVNAAATTADTWRLFFGVQSTLYHMYIVGANVPLLPVAHQAVLANTSLDYGYDPSWYSNVGQDTLDMHAAWMEGVPWEPGMTHAKAPDRGLIIYQPSSDTLWDFMDVTWREGDLNGTHFKFTAAWGGRMRNVSSSIGVAQNRWVADKKVEYENWGSSATSLPYISGNITPEECWDIVNGTIDHFPHTLKMQVGNATNQDLLYPAMRTDGAVPDPAWIPEGARLFLPRDLDLSPYTDPFSRALVITLQKYGCVIDDKTGGGVNFPSARDGDSYPKSMLPLFPGPLADATQPYPLMFGRGSHTLLMDIPWHKVKIADPAVSIAKTFPQWTDPLDALDPAHFEKFGDVTVTAGKLTFATDTVPAGVNVHNGIPKLKDCAITAEVTKVPQSGQRSTYLEVFLKDAYYVRIRVAGGTAYFEMAESSEIRSSAPYDPAAMRFWRIREQANTLFWETSPDGSAWTIRAQRATSSWMWRLLRVQFTNSASAGAASTERAELASFALAPTGTPVVVASQDFSANTNGVATSDGTVMIFDGATMARQADGTLKVDTTGGTAKGVAWTITGAFQAGHEYTATARLKGTGQTMQSFFGDRSGDWAAVSAPATASFTDVVIKWTPTANRSAVQLGLRTATAGTFYIDSLVCL